MFTICFFMVVFVTTFIMAGLVLADRAEGTVKRIAAHVKNAACDGYLNRKGLVAVPEEAPRMSQHDVDVMMRLISEA